jgi:hypothetical protein
MTHKHEVQQFHSDHLKSVFWGEAATVGLLHPAVHALYSTSPGWTVTCEGRFLCAMGIVAPYPGFGEAWCVAGPEIRGNRAHTLYFVRTSKRVILGVARDMGLRRLQATVDATWKEGQKYVEALGFRPEATLRKYGPAGQDVIMYAMFPGDV